MKILIMLGCILCGFSIYKNVKGIVDDRKTAKARRYVEKIIEDGAEENEKNGAI